MRRGGLNFLNRRNQSLFDTSVKIREFENVEIVYDTEVIADPGTAQVRSRPTVKHLSTFGDGAGVAVPTPKVPVLPPFNGAQIIKAGSTDRLSLMSIDDAEEGQILIPPPPSKAPPPPPPQFIPPSPGQVSRSSAFSKDPVPSALAPPSMPPPKPPSHAAPESPNLLALKPPAMAPPKPPGAQIQAVEDIPECPKFTPPLPPTENPQSPMSKKVPPVKPIRYSSIPNLDVLPSGATTPTGPTGGSSYNPQSSPKPYPVQKSTVLSPQADKAQTQQVPYRENLSGNPVGVHVNVKEVGSTKTPQPPVKPARRNSSGLNLEKDLQELNPETLPKQVSGFSEIGAPSQNFTIKTPPPVKTPPKPGELSAQDVIHPAPKQSYSPLLNRKLRNLKNNEPSSVKEPVASPLQLLMAAKERDKQRAGGISRKNSTNSISSIDSTGVSIQHSDTSTNSFTVTPRPAMSPESLSQAPYIETKPESPKVTYTRPEPSVPATHSPSIIMGKNVARQPTVITVTSPTGSSNVVDGITSLPFIPPPPEFANSDPEDETPPSTPPPDPPAKRAGGNPPINSIPVKNSPANTRASSIAVPSIAPSTQFKPVPQALPTSPPQFQPPSPPKTQPPSPPKTQAPSQPKSLPQVPPPTPPKIQPQASPPQQAPPSVAESQATLLSILQKKMLEIDPKFTQTPETDSGWDDWSSSVSDEDGGANQPLNAATKPRSFVQPTGLNMKELESQVAKKAQSKTATSIGGSGASARQQFGMTFMVRPGSKQPITPVPKN